VVRGISDLLDGKEPADRGGSQQRAADGASAVAFEILATLDGSGAAAAITFNEIKPTYSKAAYFAKGEVLARVGVPNVDEVSFSYERGPDAYLRLLPTKNLSRPLPLAGLKNGRRTGPALAGERVRRAYDNQPARSSDLRRCGSTPRRTRAHALRHAAFPA
jgi:hypothetical protein